MPSCRLRREYAWLDLRRNCPIQRVGSEIRSIGPAHRAILVYPGPGEQKRIAKGFKDRPEEPRGEIDFSAPAIVKQQVKSVSLASAHTHNSIHYSTPAA
jgi:hypothetical protein